MQNDIATPDRFLSVNDTIAMKAIAILCMLAHHLWTFPERIAGGPLESFFHISGLPLTAHFGVFAKICVSMFFFLGGYGLYKKYFGKRYNLFERLKKLYFAYWKIFVIFVPIGFICFSNQARRRGAEPSSPAPRSRRPRANGPAPCCRTRRTRIPSRTRPAWRHTA